MIIPVGRTYTSTMTGSATKVTTCESCHEEYVYQVERKASGEGSSVMFLDNEGATDRAERAAEKSLRKALERAVESERLGF